MKKRNEIVRTNAAHAQSQQKVNRLAAMAAILGVTAFSVAGMTTTFAVDNVAGTGEGTAFGTNSKAVQEGSIAVGNLAVTNAKAGVAIGKSSLAGVSESVIPEADQEKHTANTVAIGRNAYASYTDTVVIGTNASSLRDHGGVTFQSGTGAIAIGRNAKSDYKESVAIGPEARTNFTQSVAVGYQAETTGQQGAATAVGPIAKAYEIGAAAIGNISRASGAYSTAVGTTSATYNPFATAVGNNATTRAASDTIVGTESGTGTSAGRAVAVGFGSHVAETSGVAVGDRARAFTAGGMAIGRAATSYGAQAIAIGNGGKADGKAGENAFATGQGAIALGTTARAMGTHGFAFGNDSVAGGNADLATTVSTALDTYNTAYSTYITAQDAKLTAESDSKATQKRLASDARDFGISLYTLTNEEKQLLQTLGVDNAALQDEFFGKIESNNNYDSAKPVVTAQLAALKKIAALDENAASTTTADVTRLIKRAQDLIAENTNDEALKQKVTDTTAAATAEETKLNTAKATLEAAYKSAKESALAIGTRAVAEGKKSIAIGTDANATNENSVAIGTQAKSTADHAVAIGVKAQATVDNGVGLGSYSVADTEARKGYDLNENRMNTYAGLRGNALTASTAAVAVGTPRMTRQINYVAAGTDDTDAVNVAQLRSVNLKIAGDTVDQAAPTTDGTSKADVLLDSQTLKVVSANKAVLTTDATNNTITITPVTAELEKDPATGQVKPKDEAKGNALTTAQNVADMINNASPKIGNGLTNSDGKIVVQPADKSISVTANGVKVKTDGTTITVGDKGLQVNTGNITNVTEGDKAGTVSVPEADKGKIATIGNVADAINNAAWKATSDKEDSGEVEGTTEEKVKAGDKVTLKAGNNLKLKQAGKEFTYSLQPELKGIKSITGEGEGAGKVSFGPNGVVTVGGDNPVAIDGKDGKVTAGDVVLSKDGLDNGNKTITNVKAGEKDTDAVNVKQLKDELGKSTVKTSDGLEKDTDGNIKVKPADKSIEVTAEGVKVKPADKSLETTEEGLKVKADGTTITVGDKGLQVNTGSITNVTEGDKAGTVAVPEEADKGKVATIGNVADAINNAAWNATSGEDGTGKAEGTTKEAVKAGDTVTLKAGNNLKLKQAGKEFTYSLNPELKDLTSASFKNDAGDTTVINADGMTITPKAADKKPVSLTKDGLDNGGNQIKNVKAGTEGTDGVNVNQLTGVKNDVQDLKDELEKHINSSGFSITSDVEGTGKKAKGNTTSTEEVKDGNKITLKAGNNLEIKQDGTNFTYSLNPELTGITSIAGKGAAPTVITLKESGDVTIGKTGEEKPVTVTADKHITNVASNLPETKNKDDKGEATKSQAAPTMGTGENEVNPNNAATVGDVLNAGWNLQGNGTAVDLVKPYDTVNFVNGVGTTATVKSEDGKTSTVTYDVNLGKGLEVGKDNKITVKADGDTITVSDKGIKVNPTFVKQIKDEIANSAVKPGKGLEKDKAGNIDVKPADKSIEVTTAGVKVKAADKSLETTDKGLKVKADGTTITVGDKGLQVNTGTITVNAKDGKDGKAGTVSVPKADQGKIATVGDVAKAINNAAWQAKGGQTGTGVVTGNDAAQPVKAGDVVTFNAGNNLKLTQAGSSFTYELNPTLTGLTSAEFKAGDNTTKIDGNGITLTPAGAGKGAVSLTNAGLNNGGNKITNVAAGTDPTDAVNVSQLRDAAGNMQAITNQLQGQVNRVGSQAAALSALKPIQYDPLEPTQIMAGVGHYQGQNSLALGVAHYKNESLMFHAGAAIGGNRSQVMANAGITWKVGAKADETAVADVYRQGPISSAYVLQDKMGALEAQNLEQKGEINALREENKSQRAELDAVKAQLATVLSRLQG
ncbi:autotransporter adhesin [Veillonella sp. oral taxon 780]|uniref:autotransporter adhesin n=1 Tax=Veillonella sp. oral taxon 780 TaxID=671229 RepID=UPI00021A25D7|nr:autotransporter adhesin [Veillonella sp. oral taxon 780]EGS36632.1 YadA-like C-terminal domain protein [Veillonella sp. oral taxon 780 str. F0422]